MFIMFLFYTVGFVVPESDQPAVSRQIAEFAEQEQFSFIYNYGNTDFAEHVQANRAEWENVRDYPKRFHAYRFVGHRDVASSQRVAIKFEIERVESIQQLNQDRFEQFDPILAELKHRFACWDALEDAFNPNDSYARKRLEDLKTLLGHDMWSHGEMP